MQHLEVSCAVRPLKWSLGVKWLMNIVFRPSKQIRVNIIEGHIRGKTEKQKNNCIYMDKDR